MLNITAVIGGIIVWFVAFYIITTFFIEVENNYQDANNKLNDLKKAEEIALDQLSPDPSEELMKVSKEVEKWSKMRPAVWTGLVSIIAIPIGIGVSYARNQ